jgi:uncharacterized protein YegJ (DUF2314 family)
MTPDPSLERSSTGTALGRRAAQAYHAPRRPSALPLPAAQLKRQASQGSPMVRALVLASLSLAAASLRGWSQTITERAERDEVTHMASEEPAMREAFAKAKATLSDFLTTAGNPPAGTTGFALKVAISDGKNTEYFWVNKFSSAGSVFTGVLNNEPRLVKRHKLGETISFDEKQIADWTYVDQTQRRMVGNFTACALLTKEPPAQAEAFKRQYGLRCE